VTDTPNGAAQEIADLIETAIVEAHETPVPQLQGFDIDEMNERFALVLVGDKAVVVVQERDGPPDARLKLLTTYALETWFSNRWTQVREADGKIKNVTWAKAWLKHPERRQFLGIEFWPNPDGAPGTNGYLNLWRGFSVEPSETGTWHTFRDHLLNNVCDSDESIFRWVFGFFAHMVQKPRERIGTALVLRGGQGAGKSKVGEIFGSLFARHFFMVDDPRYITGQFNVHMASCLLLQADEAVWAGDKVAEGRLKGLITSKHQFIEAKGIDPVQLKNYVHVVMTSNASWIVPAGKEERRFCVLDVNPRCLQNSEYFGEMDAELDSGGRARLLHDLLTFPLESVDLRQIPRTAALLEQKIRTLDRIEGFWLDCLMAGCTLRSEGEWRSEVPCHAFYNEYATAADRVGVRRKSDETSFGIQLRNLVPGLTRKQRTIQVSETERRRTTVYCFPPLRDCREAFERLVGQAVPWGEGETGAEFAGEEEVPL
jgi:hypothetical protein